jgi:hypothetical protein
MFISTDGIPIKETKLDCIKKIISYIPNVNQEILCKFCILLGEIAKNSNENKMGVQNLAIVFCPTLLKTKVSLKIFILINNIIK